MKKVFIDGSAGTTGLKVRERLSSRTDIELVVLSEDLRKDPSARRDAINSADVAFLCLPDAAAVEAVAMVENPSTVVIDTSTAHRTAEGWEYGFPELRGRRERIASSRRIANPGCHASGFIALVEPLVKCGILPPDAPLCAFSLTGYSGGGKKMIAQYELTNPLGGSGDSPRRLDGDSPRRLDGDSSRRLDGDSPRQALPLLFLGGRQYALAQAHKHLPEMAAICGISRPPVFSPVVVPHFSGMEVTVQLSADALKGGIDAVRRCYGDYYCAPGLVSYAVDPAAAEEGFLSSAGLASSDAMQVSAYGNGERVVLVSRFDNLGKGASGAAIQNMNIALGCDEATGLVTS